jgi:hypothetical protein
MLKFYNAAPDVARLPRTMSSHLATEFDIGTVDASESARRSGASSARRRFVPSSRVVLLLVWLASAAYAVPFVDRGWIAHDEGTLAQSAERVAQGQVPHRDFDEGYTGGLSYLHALSFRVFGTNLLALRFTLLAFFLAAVPVVYGILRRALSPLAAAAATFTCVAWTVPNYFAAMPSWYNLFLALFGAYAVLRHIETARLRWLFLAGVFAGLSIVVKIIGLYDVAAVLLFLAWREQQLSERRARGAGASAAFAILKTVLGAAFVAVLFVSVRTRMSAVDILHFIAPGTAVVLLLVGTEWREGSGRFLDRARALARLAAPFAAGTAIPIGVFVACYAAAGGLPALFEGLFVRPQRQIATASLDFAHPWLTIAAIPLAAVLAFPGLVGDRPRRLALTVAFLFLACLLALGFTLDGYQWIWNSALSLDVVAVLVGCAWLSGSPPSTVERRQQLFLWLALAACMGLVQYPFSAPIYFCYAVPFTVFAIAYLVSSDSRHVRPFHAGVLFFYLAFALLFLNPGYIYYLGGGPLRYHPDGRLSIDRGGLRISAQDAQSYAELAAAVSEKARGAEIFAGPEAPEVYFLCKKRNLTRIFFEGASGIRPGTNTDGLRRFFERPDLKVVVWNRRPHFTHGLWRVYREQLWERFPHTREIGKFTLMWRD